MHTKEVVVILSGLCLDVVHICVSDTGQNLDFALKTLSSSLEDSSDVIRPLQFPPAPGPRGLTTMREVMRTKISEEEGRRVQDVAFARVLLSHYRNQLIHLFVAEAMVALCVSCCLPCTQSMSQHTHHPLSRSVASLSHKLHYNVL